MARITRVEILQVDLIPLVVRTDAIQSFVKQETPMVRITTEDGLTGTGYAYTVGSGGSAVVALLRDHLAPRLIGRNPLEIEAIWKDLFFSTHSTAVGAITALALATIDTALWDWKCLAPGRPLWIEAGGAQPRVPVYTTEGGWLHIETEALVEDALRAKAAGFKGSKIKVGRPHASEEAVGDERTYKFSMSFDPAVLNNPTVAVGANTPGASITVNSTLLASGRLGVTLTLAEGQQLPQSSTLELANVMFDANPTTPAGTETIIGFLDQPVSKSVVSTNGGNLVALFAAGTITLEDWTASATAQFLPNGTFQLSISGPPNHTYVIEATTNIAEQIWPPVSINSTSAGGSLQFIDGSASGAPQRFYRARMVN